MKKINCIVIILMSLLYLEANGNTWSLNWDNFSVSKERMKDYLSQCAFLPSLETMEKELQDQIRSLVELERLVKDKREPYMAKPFKYDHSLWNSLKSNDIEYIDIDGFRMKKISALELETLLELTSYNTFYKTDPRHLLTIEVKNKTLFIKRQCHMKACRDRAELNLNSIYDLHLVKNDAPFPLCENLFCASERIFGYKKNIYLIYAAFKYKVNLSKYSHIHSDPKGLGSDHLKMILTALGSVPEHLQEEILKGRSFFRRLKGYFDPNSSISVVANDSGALFEIFFNFKWSDKFYILVHEMGHWTDEYDSSRDWYQLSKRDEWLAISGFFEVRDGDNEDYLKEYKKRPNRVSISYYGNKNPLEDFAESYVMYRFDPKRMKAKFPKRYNFMLYNLFDGTEYTENLCKGIKNETVFK